MQFYLNGIYDAPETRISLTDNFVSEDWSRSFWAPNTTDAQHSGSIKETINVHVRGNQRDIISSVAHIERMGLQASRWHANPVRKNSVWLYWHVDDEPYPKRTLIYSLRFKFNNRSNNHLVTKHIYGTLEIARHHRWERIDHETQRAADISTQGGTFFWRPSGTDNSRISELTLKIDSNADYPHGANEVWVGIRDCLFGMDDFQPRWDLELGSKYTTACTNPTVNIVDDGCGGGAIEIPFTDTNDLQPRWQIKVADVAGISGNPLHFIGRYLVLARVRTTSDDDQMFIQLRYGNSANNNKVTEQKRHYITCTNWHYAELGEVQIPAGVNRVNAVNDIRNSEIEVWAGRRVGNGSLFVDHLVLIPSAHFMKLHAQPNQFAGDTLIQIRTHEDDSTSAEITMSAGAAYQDVPCNRDWHWPLEGGLMVIAANRHQFDDCSNIDDCFAPCNDVAQLQLETHSRWMSYMDEFAMVK